MPSCRPDNQICVVLGVLLLSGYCRIPYHELYWATSPYLHNEAVSKSISRNRFREIFHFLHMSDNLQITDDRYYKVTVFMNVLYHTMASMVESNLLGENPFVSGSSYGVLQHQMVHAEPFCGGGTDLDETGLGQGPDVVLALLKKANATGGSTITCDNLFVAGWSTITCGNLFTTLPLLGELTKLGIVGIETFRENRLLLSQRKHKFRKRLYD